MISLWSTLMLMVLPRSWWECLLFLGQVIWWYGNPWSLADSGVVILLPLDPSQWPCVLEKVSAGASERGLGNFRNVSERCSAMAQSPFVFSLIALC